MGFLQLIPATQLTARYDAFSHQLILSASGQTPQFTAAINFHRDQNFVGGLKFDLQGWVGPLTGDMQSYEKTQNVDIMLPSPVINSKSVIIVDANHPEGVPVTIEYAELKKNGKSITAADLTTSYANDTQTTASPANENITALLGRDFQIKHPAVLGTYGASLDISFDNTDLELITAGIQGTNIVWTFRPLQVSNTAVVVTTFGGIATYVLRETYDVRIIQPEIQAMPKAAAPDKAILSYLGRVNIGLNLIKAQYPDAQLYEVDSVSAQPTSNPNDLKQMRIVCRAGAGTAIIQATGWGTFGPVQYIDSPWLEDQVINWPISMDITEADKLLKAAGYTGDYRNVTLRKPLYPGVYEPSYIFGMINGLYVFVGVEDKKVSVNGTAATLADAKA
ncbi:hypothetical protein [Taibaiella soli]|uniref:Uncharacterized protein n=1 Tax=Taibaiella soli TaxID=1649169 RepID=A0A2W2A6G5_9BACT|nr:hypothetical protein [Taibaiella soli]PZF70841.1 hypothetical protein DN068_21610 [Taibaiella soli]